MKLERLEVRLRPKNPAEQALIEALEAQDGIYGGKNELMRESLLRGYSVLKQKMESLSGSTDEVATHDVLAQTFASGEYGYRVVRTYLDARNQAKAGSNGQPSDKVVAAPAAADLVQTVVGPSSTAPVPADGAGEGAPKRKVDWSRMRGLAGSGGGEDGS